ncbi:MAG: acetyltransferase [Anaerolineales bacterium]|jgi:UDP-perosamine 4-acetyltransferase
MKLIGLGAGGHAKVVIEILQLKGEHELVGLLDPKQELWNSELLGIPVLGNDDLLAELYDRGVRGVFIGLGTVGENNPRRNLFLDAKEHGYQIVPAIHPQAVLSPSARVGEGLTMMAGAVVNAATSLGDNVIINTGAIVDHDCVIGNHVHIATGARLASSVQVDEGVHIGLGASIRQSIHIGRNSVVGAGAVVVDDVPENVVVVGIPAHILRKVQM